MRMTRPGMTRLGAIAILLMFLLNGTLLAQATEMLKRSAQFVEKHDANKDGKLSEDEFPKQLKAAFARVDMNKDGMVTVKEDAAYRVRQTRGKIPAGVTAHRDLEYAKIGDKRLLLDIYVPDTTADSDEPLPLIVWIHGGAWRAGNKKNCPPLRFTDKGFVAASISYRLSQEAPFPAQIEDCKAAIRWLRANAVKYRIDPDRIGVWGSSAGGHLVALLGTSGDVEQLESEHQHQEQSSRVQAVCDFFGPTDFLRMDADSLPGGPIQHDAADSPESMLVGGPIQENTNKVARANPITYVSPEDPPFLIVHGDKDPLVPWQQSKYLYEAMKKAGLGETTEFQIVKGAKHGFRGNPDVELMVDRFFAKYLGSPKAKPPAGSPPGN